MPLNDLYRKCLHKLYTDHTAPSQPGDALAAESDWFIRTGRGRRFPERKSSDLKVSKNLSGLSPVSGLITLNKNEFFCSVENLSSTHSGGIAGVTSSLPRRGRQHAGTSLPDPHFRSILWIPIYGHAPRGEGRKTPGARGSIVINTKSSIMISTEQVF